MTNKISIILLLTMLVASVVLFAVTEVMATDRPTVCYAGDNITLSLDSGSPTFIETNKVWEFSYTAVCTSASVCGKINKLVLTFPTVTYLPNVLEVRCPPDLGSCEDSRPVGDGDPSTGMGEAEMVKTITIPAVEGANDNELAFKIRSNVGSMGVASVGFNFGKNKLIGCFADADPDPPLSQPYVGGIASAGFDLAAIVRPGTALFRIIPLDENNCIRVDLYPGTLCASSVEWWKNGTCTGTSEGTIDEEDDPVPVAIFAGTGNQFCPEGFRQIDVPGFSPCYEYVSGGRTRYIPRGCN